MLFPRQWEPEDMLKAVELRKGKTILRDGDLFIVHEIAHVAKGNKRSYMQSKLKNFKTGVISEVRYSVDERVEIPFVESKEYEFLYRDGENYVLMDTATYDQLPINANLVGDASKWLKPNEKLTCELYEERVISVVLPLVVELEVTDTPPVLKGATATNQSKEAILETGAKVRVPPFIGPGTVIRVDTRTGEYLERAK